MAERKRLAWLLALVAAFGCLADGAHSQERPAAVEEKPEQTGPAAPDKVEVQPVARDEQIAQRLQRILKATGWFQDPAVRVEEGVVFLNGRTTDEQYKDWAGSLARNTRDVVAVVNRIEVTTPSVWDLRPALAGMQELWRDMVASLPLIVFGILVLLLAYGAAILIARALRPFLGRKFGMPLLQEVVARAVGILVFLLGLYIVLKVSGLTRLAVTVLGGTGLVGLVIGIAFRDITENFLASILLSMQQPFRSGDLVEISGIIGYVQQLNVRTTVLMTLTGNHVQIPNATVYKSTIKNYTSNPNRREDFTVGIGYDVQIADAQKIALDVLAGHPAVLKHPEPWVLADSLGPGTVNLRVYFWIDGSQHSWLKVKSSAIRLVKRAFQAHGVSMPDEAREVLFPEGVPVHLLDHRRAGEAAVPSNSRRRAAEPRAESAAVEAEGGLHSEAKQIEEQARLARNPEEGENLLRSPSAGS
jgi:small-conductance mechanosensitive channel